MKDKLKLIAGSFGYDRVKLNEPVARYTSIGMGGPAGLFYVAFTQRELTKMVNYCRDLDVPFFIFGTGSKIMVSDTGFDGVIIKNRTSKIRVISVKGKVSKYGIGVEEAMIEVESGISMNKFCEFLASQNLASEEFVNIPGSIGGNVFLNKSLQTKTESIKVIDREGRLDKITPGELSLNKHVVLSVVIKIKAK
ncbi:FAD-binding protein [Candidatus Daviesbacteria bacterium]|nr:FAD-binding protein [Candidatus Daviesbacteria bacterium]